MMIVVVVIEYSYKQGPSTLHFLSPPQRRKTRSNCIFSKVDALNWKAKCHAGAEISPHFLFSVVYRLITQCCDPNSMVKRKLW